MIDRCMARGVPILICTQPSNERDLAPLGREGPPGPADDGLDERGLAAQLGEGVIGLGEVVEGQVVAEVYVRERAQELAAMVKPLQNAAANLPGVVAPWLTGYLLTQTGSYTAPMYSILFFLALGVGAYVFLVKQEYAPKAG